MTEDQILKLRERIREQVFDDLSPVEPFAAEVKRTVRTIYRWITQGLPAVYVGNEPHVVISKARPWMEQRRATADLPHRRRGRPRKIDRAAA